ncbi:MAG: hypothetical protein CL912_00995 [Deltaproteobacteria bacterium]|nr:hypothetical protein [Deltaproteobacteria bacterium]
MAIFDSEIGQRNHLVASMVIATALSGKIVFAKLMRIHWIIEVRQDTAIAEYLGNISSWPYIIAYDRLVIQP